MDRMILTTLRLPARLEAALTKHTVANLRAQRRPAPGAAPTVHELVAMQMDRSYATAHRVMREARHRLPSYTPRRVLDFGAGQSPMAWAAQASWPGAPLQVCAVEPSAALRQDGERLCAAAYPNPNPSPNPNPNPNPNQVRGREHGAGYGPRAALDRAHPWRPLRQSGRSTSAIEPPRLRQRPWW